MYQIIIFVILTFYMLNLIDEIKNALAFINTETSPVVEIQSQGRQEYPHFTYRKVSNIRRTKYQNLNASRFI